MGKLGGFNPTRSAARGRAGTRRRNKPGCTHVEQVAYEVQWYRKHGKHQDRVQLDDLGREYVVHDFRWNKLNHYRRESVRDQLANFVQYRVTGIKR